VSLVLGLTIGSSAAALDARHALIVFMVRIAQGASSHFVLSSQSLLLDTIGRAECVVRRGVAALLSLAHDWPFHGFREVASTVAAYKPLVIHAMLSAHVLR